MKLCSCNIIFYGKLFGAGHGLGPTVWFVYCSVLIQFLVRFGIL
jgi:hypothetical protein